MLIDWSARVLDAVEGDRQAMIRFPADMLNGHIDVVPPGDRARWSRDPFTRRIGGGCMHGRGTCDMKAGLVAAFWAVRALRRAHAPLRGDVLLASVQSEEDGGLGTYATLRRGWRADAYPPAPAAREPSAPSMALLVRGDC